MSNGLSVRALFDGIAAACVSAWSVTSVDPEIPRTAPRTLPYAVAMWQPVQISWNGVKTRQDYTFLIVGRFAFPSDPTKPVALEKSDRADELIARLQTGSTFATVGLLPLVTSVDPTESDDLAEGAYEVTLTFTCAVAPVDHH